MHGCVSRQSFKPSRHIHKVPDRWVPLIERLEILAFRKCLVKGNSKLIRNQSCNLINIGIRHVKHSSDIPYNSLCRKCTKCYNLHHLIIAIFSYNVVNHFLTALIAEIYIYIRH